jgi:Glycosyltransferase family 29 (sialyltransferase)
MTLLIGNGPSGDTPAVAAAMLRASRVLRMNNWQPGQHTGTRCNIWGTSFNTDIIVRDALETWWTGWPYGHVKGVTYDEALAGERNNYERVASKELIDRATPADGRNPSTGLVLAMMAAELGPIALAGFDHFQGPAHHYWKDQPDWDPLEYHDPEHERKMVLELGAEIVGC